MCDFFSELPSQCHFAEHEFDEIQLERHVSHVWLVVQASAAVEQEKLNCVPLHGSFEATCDLIAQGGGHGRWSLSLSNFVLFDIQRNTAINDELTWLVWANSARDCDSITVKIIFYDKESVVCNLDNGCLAGKKMYKFQMHMGASMIEVISESGIQGLEDRTFKLFISGTKSM